jgi:cephalosporin hydroxylase
MMTQAANNPIMAFEEEKSALIESYGNDDAWKKLSGDWLRTAFEKKYMYNFSFMGRPIIQTPVDMIALHEIIWDVQPDLIIEAGIAHGGSIIFSAAMLELNAACGGPADAGVLAIDIDIRAHNRAAIENHPMAKRITMLEGSSTSQEIITQVHDAAKGKKKVLVILDSNHTHEHVMAELEAYAPLTSIGSYCIVFDTIVEDLPADMWPDRPWSPGDNPKTAVWEYLKSHPEFEIDQKMDNKLMISVAPNGYLKRVK